MGIAGGANGYERAEDLMRDADTALHCAKVAGRSRFEIFDTTMRRRAITRLQVETDLRRALERHELRLHYQPIVDLRTGAIAGFEALVRWQHPLRGMISPMEFIPVAEETGLIVPAGHWIIEQACRDVERWLGTVPAGPLLPGGALTLHVNFSPVQFAELGAIDEIERILRRCWPAGRGFGLSFEITESTMMQNSDNVSVLLARLRDLHIGLDIDDFGTGYSSLSHLARMPADEVKIDRSFVQGLESDVEYAAVVRSAIDMAHSLGLKVVAEGIETEFAAQRLRTFGCDVGQGYLYAKPMPYEQLIRWLDGKQRAPFIAIPIDFDAEEVVETLTLTTH
jgi:EAL domain-containing protein (putative c-di-GMP-specific phosphodiesterase class I)